MKTLRRGLLLKEYGEIGQNFRKLTDIRFRVLGFLPLASGASVAVLLSSEKLGGDRALGLALFGLAITLGLITYNVRNDQLYDELIGRAAHIERQLGLQDGQFAGRPRAWLTLNFGRVSWPVSHRSAIYLIYTSAIILWLSVALAVCFELIRFFLVEEFGPFFLVSDPLSWVDAAALTAAVTIVAWGYQLISRQLKAQSASLRTCAAGAYARVAAIGLPAVLHDADFLQRCAELAGDVDPKVQQTLGRARYSIGAMQSGTTAAWFPGSPPYDAAVLVAALTDMPARWIFDMGENRRGAVGGAAPKAAGAIREKP